MRRSIVLAMSSLLLATPLILAGCSSDSNPTTVTPKVQAQFVGADRCAFCHPKAHGEWKDSWHTRKTTYGPNWPGKAAEGKAKFLPGVIDMWEAGEMKSHLILERATVTADDKTAGITNKNYITAKKYDWKDVDIIVGETRKQRYAVYYDGGAVNVDDGGVIYSVSKDGGINWSIPEGQTPFDWAGKKERAGYKFLTVEMDATKKPDHNEYQKPSMYGEFWSWQERCIGCHTTGFDVAAWNTAKSDFVAGNRDDLRDIFVADIRISCEACHGDGGKHAESRLAADIINPANLKGDDRMLACNQCHTRTNGNLLHTGAPNDNRGLVLGQDSYLDVMSYVRPAWGKGSRAVSIDGKGRRDHQQDMDILLTKYINDELKRGNSNNPHGDMACFKCHNAHGVGNVGNYSVSNPDKSLFTTGKDADGTVRLKDTRQNVCTECHRAEEVDGLLAVMNGRTGFGTADGFKATGYPRVEPARGWDTPFGRQDKKQHIFSTDGEGRSWGLYPEEYVWALPIGATEVVGNETDAVKIKAIQDSYKPIWPWEKDLFKKNNHNIFYGPAPWKGVEGRTDGQLAPVVKTAFAEQFTGPGACAECHKAAHNEWKNSWHTMKATYGPAFEGQSAGESNINPWALANWDNLKSYMILDAVPTAVSNANSAIPAGSIYLTPTKYQPSDVAIIVGATRKQRYAVYYDGSAVANALIAEPVGTGHQIIDGVTANFPGNKERAGYKFLFIELSLTGETTPVESSHNYNEWRSWQERCIGCHTTGFDVAAWNAAKADFVADQRDDLKDIFVADIRISCESCHGPGADHVIARREYKPFDAREIINPATMPKDTPDQIMARQAVCGQCHTRTQKNLDDDVHQKTLGHTSGFANDNRGFVLGGDRDLMDVFQYTRPIWGGSNRQVSADGKGKRDHQQDMDIMLTNYLRGGDSYHGAQACFDCHNSHGVGISKKLNVKPLEGAQSHLLTKNDDGTLRLKEPKVQMCGQCHTANTHLGLLNGQEGWASSALERGRGDHKQHIFASQTYFDGTGAKKLRSFGLYPEEYIWGQTANLNWVAIWPWEKDLDIYIDVHVGATPPQ